jgi:tripartite-type tricarboxylate transporter receptor subunit TctC
MQVFRTLMTLVALIAGLEAAQAQTFQDWPNRPVRLIVPFAAGGSTDVAARLIGDYLSRTAGQPFYVENRTGANGVIAWTRPPRATLTATPSSSLLTQLRAILTSTRSATIP